MDFSLKRASMTEIGSYEFYCSASGLALTYVMEAYEAVTNMMMDVEQNMEGPPPDGEGSLEMVSGDAAKPSAATSTAGHAYTNSSGCFDCNICLDFAVDPVVTLCGHLYCWPCIYKWLQVEDGISPQSCPVCKASLSEDSLVPLYGRGKPAKRHDKARVIPRRPSVPRVNASGMDPHSPRSPWHHNYHHGAELSSSSSLALSGSQRLMTTTAGGVLGEMAVAVFPSVFRNHQSAVAGDLFYSSVASPRLRRLEMRAVRLLNQIWLFLLCCTLLCLLLF